MKSCHQRCLASLLFFFTLSSLIAQDQRNFNQNASRSNRGLSISFSPVYSLASNKSSDSLLFRGSGAGFQFGADYFFGNAGISFTSGFGSSSPDDATINIFLKRFPFSPDELILTKAKQQNMYMLLGPSVRLGSTVQLYAHAKGGLFINNSGLVSIQQKGAQRAVYRNESTAKSIYPGFLTGLRVQYSTKSDKWSFGIGADYMNTKSEVNNYDARRGGGIEALKLSRNITDIVTGVTVRYNILSPRDHASGQASGKRVLPTVNKRETASPRDAASGLATGRRTHQPGQPNYEDMQVTRDAASGLATGRRTYQPGQPVYGNITREESTTESCGTVTQRTTNPDGTTEEMTFACPGDAANYNNRMKIDGGMPNRISMNVTVPKQTQGATFGEKVNQGLHAAGSALSQGASRNIISGRLSQTSGSSTGIITNKIVGGGGSGAAAASYAATGMVINSPATGGIVTTLYARDASSGMATGKRSRDASSGMATGRRSRDAGSGMPTGRRQYEPIFSDGQGDVCNPCIATVTASNKMSNPYFKNNAMSGDMVEVNKAAGDDDCDGIGGMAVSLLDPQSGAMIAKTITESCGDFFFANVPDGDYVVKVSGTFMSRKGYQYYASKSATDMLGKIELGDASMQLLINTSNENDGVSQKAGISTSRSNIRNKSFTIIEADADGDGKFESTKVLALLNNGTTKDITAMSRMSTTGSVKKVTVQGWDPEKKQTTTGAAAVKEYTISIDNDNRAVLTNQYENGTKEEVSVTAKVSHHPNVVQYIIPLDDTQNDGGRVKTKSNIKNDRAAAGDIDDGETGGPGSSIKTIRLFAADVDGDGTPEMVTAAPFVPGGAVISAAMSPGNPIGGLTIKGGKNPGGNLRTVQSDANGEFEYAGLEAGDYTFTIEQKTVIEDETFVSIGGNSTRAQDHNSSRSNKSGIVNNDPDNGDDAARKGWDGTVKGGSKAQDHNSSRSNKSGIVNNDPDNGDDAARKGWDGTVKGGSKAQDHNSSRSNKSGIVNNDPDNGGDSNKKIPVRWAAPESLKSIQVLGDLDNDGEYETDITSRIHDEIKPNDEIVMSQQKAGISTSRSNIRSRSALQDKGDDLYIAYGRATISGSDVAVKILYSAKQGKSGSAK